jgi:hypothetical protein
MTPCLTQQPWPMMPPEQVTPYRNVYHIASINQLEMMDIYNHVKDCMSPTFHCLLMADDDPDDWFLVVNWQRENDAEQLYDWIRVQGKQRWYNMKEKELVAYYRPFEAKIAKPN